MQTSISAFVITKNEEKNIQNCLESLKWADEIIVVDAQSEDKTLEIAKKYSNKVFVRAWSGCSPELISFLKKFKQSGPGQLSNLIHLCDAPHPKGVATKKEVSLIEVKRLEHFRGKIYFYGEKTPSYQWRLFKRQDCEFIGEVHEYVTFEGEIRRIEFPILHFPPETLSLMMDKINTYSSLDAEALYKKGVKHNVLYVFSGLSIFLKSYFRKGGYKDGVLVLFSCSYGDKFFSSPSKALFKT
ncbi:MAG: glycosyltransferase family 2 protein [Oligoflexia bacterium]|nr:glycosyltransferase family 2 protein [Oligoflexia bacterium]